MHKTILVKLAVESKDKLRLQATFSDYKVAWQFVSNHVFKSKCRNRLIIHNETYKGVRKLVPNLSSALVQEARNDAIAKSKSVKSNGHKVYAAPKLKNISVRFDKRTASLKGNILSFTANSSAGTSESGGKRIKAELVAFPRFDEHRTFKTLAPLIFYRDGQYWAAITFDIPESPVKDGSILGVDMGLRILAATSNGMLIRGNKMNRLRRRVRHLKRALQSKGTKSARRHSKRLSRKEQRQSRDVTHCAVNQLLKTESSILAVEELDLRAKKYRKSSNRRRFSVPISEFVRILEYKAKLHGKQVVKVNPAYTSQDDCRGLEKGERIGGKYIGVDGKILHADINAACNIAIRAKETLKLNNLCSPLYERVMEQGTVNCPNVENRKVFNKVCQTSEGSGRSITSLTL